jgi:vesicle coat complex subunit
MKELSTIEEFMESSKDKDYRVRKYAVKNICACKIKKEIDTLWERVFEMYEDENPQVRRQVVHNLCDGSPNKYESRVVDILEKMYNDKDDGVKKYVRRALNSYRKTGKWNIY